MGFSVRVFLALPLFLALHCVARELPSFDKVSPVDTGAELKKIPEHVEPTFLPETDNAYGLEGKIPTAKSGADFNPHLPKNYNPVAYVTQPEEFKEPSVPEKENFYAVDESEELHENPSKYGYNEEGQVYSSNYNGDSDKPASLIGESDEGHGINSNYNERHRYDFGYNGDSPKPTSLIGGSLFRGSESSFYTGETTPQGMSDTRAFENGKYFYDLNAEKFNVNHPYEVMKQGFDENRYFPSNRGSYGGNSFSGAGEGYSNSWP